MQKHFPLAAHCGCCSVCLLCAAVTLATNCPLPLSSRLILVSIMAKSPPNDVGNAFGCGTGGLWDSQVTKTGLGDDRELDTSSSCICKSLQDYQVSPSP